MTKANHQIVRDLFAALATGNVPETMLTDDMTSWTTTSGRSPRDKYQGGIKMLKSLFTDGPHYHIDSLTAEEDRVAAEVRGEGTLKNGEPYAMTYVFMFRIRDGKIASVAEHFNPIIIREKIWPLLGITAPQGRTSS